MIDAPARVTTGNDAHIKVIAEDLNGDLSKVVSAMQARRVGPFHKDSSTRSHTGDMLETTLETITVPGGKLGTDGRLVLEMVMDFTGTNGTKTVRLYWGAGGAIVVTFGSAFVGSAYWNVTIANNGSVSAQDIFGFVVDDGSDVTLIRTTRTEDSSSDVDIAVKAQLGNGADQANLSVTIAEFRGTN